MGSTVVLVFEAPKNFKFNIQPHQKINVGQKISQNKKGEKEYYILL